MGPRKYDKECQEPGYVDFVLPAKKQRGHHSREPVAAEHHETEAHEEVAHEEVVHEEPTAGEHNVDAGVEEAHTNGGFWDILNNFF